MSKLSKAPRYVISVGPVNLPGSSRTKISLAAGLFLKGGLRSPIKFPQPNIVHARSECDCSEINDNLSVKSLLNPIPLAIRLLFV